MGRSNATDEAIERLRREEATGEGRVVDMRIDFEFEGEIMLTAGGVWDRRESPAFDEYVDQAESGVVVRLHPGQKRAVEWFAAWLEAHRDRRATPPPLPEFDLEAFEVDTDASHAYSALFAGGRRAGKTWIAVAFAVAYAIMYPRAIVWIASPSDEKHDEIRRYLQDTIAECWLDRQVLFEYDFINGSSIALKSAHDPELLKEGKAHLVILNEGQRMKQRAFVLARGAIVDASGLVIVCANPPVEAGDEQWVSDFAADATLGKRAAVYLEFNPLLNPHIDRRALLSMRAELDERTFAIEVLGQFRGPKDAVAYNWVRLENERVVTDEFDDVTARFLELAGEGEGISHIVGLDVQRFPYIGGPWYKLYVPFGTLPTWETVIAWIVGETVLEGGDEVDFCRELREAELDPEATLIICDATGEYQHSRRRATDMAPQEWSGRGSFQIIAGEGYRKIVPPDRYMRKKNPAIVDRVRAFTSMVCSGVGVRRLFADPSKAPQTCKAIREWKSKHGAPSRTQDVAHLGDGVSYPIVRLFPRRLRESGKSGNPQAVKDPIANRVDNVIAMPARASDRRIIPVKPGRGSRTRGL
jgi:hypothetical protein